MDVDKLERATQKIAQLELELIQIKEDRLQAIEDVQELAQDLISAKEDASKQLLVSNTLLQGFHVLADVDCSEQAMNPLLDVLQQVLAYEHALILRQQNDVFVPIAMTTDGLIQSEWKMDTFLEKIIEQGESRAILNILMLPQWAKYFSSTQSITSAIFIPVQTGKSTALIVGLHSEAGAFANPHVEQANRFRVMAAQALRNIEFTESLSSQVKAKTQDLETALEEAQSANRAKSQFLANMSHEIRTPLNSVLAFSELLRMTELSAEQTESVDSIHGSGNALLSVINDILNFSKIEAGQMSLHPQSFHFRQLIEELLSTFVVDASAKRINLGYSYSCNTPDLIYADSDRVRQILVNLLSNAVKFTNEGQIFINVDSRRNGRKIDLFISVTDTGIGIPRDDISTLFQPFCQVDSSLTRVYGGTGLGLTICRTLCEMMGGEISVESSSTDGTTFSLHIEVASVDRSYQDPFVPDSELNKKNIVLLDHNINNLDVLTYYLTGWGMNTWVVDSIEEMLVVAKENSADICLISDNTSLDETQNQALLMAESLPDVARIVLTSKISTQFPEWRDSFGAMLTTPVRRKQLHGAVSDLLNPQFVPYSTMIAAESSPCPPVDDLKILIVEDNLVNQRVMKRLLKKVGYSQMDIVGNGQLALDALAQKSYDVVLMDIQMPVMDGGTAMRYIHEIYGKNAPHIIAVTAHALTGDREKYLNMGADEYLSKPLRIDKLCAKLSRLRAKSSSPINKEEKFIMSTKRYPEGVDESLLISQYEEDAWDFFSDLYELFITDSQVQLGLLETAVSSNDYASVKKIAHRLKGSSPTIGAAQLASDFLALEMAAKAKSSAEMQDILARIQAQMIVLQAYQLPA